MEKDEEVEESGLADRIRSILASSIDAIEVGDYRKVYQRNSDRHVD